MTTTPKERTFWMRWAGLTLGVVALLFLGLVTPAVAAGKVHRVTLTMKEFRYEPATLHLKVGEAGHPHDQERRARWSTSGPRGKGW